MVAAVAVPWNLWIRYSMRSLCRSKLQVNQWESRCGFLIGLTQPKRMHAFVCLRIGCAMSVMLRFAALQSGVPWCRNKTWGTQIPNDKHVLMHWHHHSTPTLSRLFCHNYIETITIATVTDIKVAFWQASILSWTSSQIHLEFWDSQDYIT